MKKITLLLVAILIASLQFASSAQKPFEVNINGDKTIVTLEEYKRLFPAQLSAGVEELNRQCPMEIDDFLTFQSAKYDNNCVYTVIKLDLDLTELTDSEKEDLVNVIAPSFVKGLKQSLLNVDKDMMPISEWARLYRELDLKFNIKVTDKNGEMISEFNDSTANFM